MSVNMQGAAQGAAIGTSIMPGWGTAIGAVAGAFMGGSAGGGGGASGAGGGPVATPQASQAAAFGSGLDGSGWAVNFGSGSIDLNNAQDKTIDSAGPTASASASQGPYLPGMGQGGGLLSDALGFGIPPVVWMGVFAVAAWRMYNSKK